MSMISKKYRNMESLWTWFDHNLDVESRTIYMGSTGKTNDDDESGVDNFMAEYFIKAMHLLEKDIEKEISILMNNPGGDWYHGMAIYDAIFNSNCTSTIKVYGYAMSMGAVILQAADQRIMMPNSRFMLHYGSDGNHGHAKNFEKWGDESKRINFQMENIFVDKMLSKLETEGSNKYAKTVNAIFNREKALEIPPTIVNYTFSGSVVKRKEELRKIIKEMLNFDTILSAEETVNLGFADLVYENK